MKSRNVADLFKNAMGTVFLLAGAFFVCSTLVSMRAVFADPIAPVNDVMIGVPQSNAAGAPRTGRPSPRGTTATTISRGTDTTNVVASPRTVAPRATASRTAVTTPAASRTTTNSPRVTTSTNSGRGVATRTTGRTTVNANRARAVTPRTATNNAASVARISLSGSVIRGSKASTSSQYSYLSSKLYTGNYSNIIDSTTGLISADAYSNCLESYYTCMDEICTARNSAQGRCSCAYRARAFREAQDALETANEELIKVSGELALLIANKGKDVSSAFQLTDAEIVMNCVSWQEMSNQYKGKEITEEKAKEWCQAHGIYDDSCSGIKEPAYCKDVGDGANSFGFDISKLNINASDIFAQLVSWSKAKKSATDMIISNDTELLNSYQGVADIVSGMTNGEINDGKSADDLDKLANTWGYDLFEYAHNNVCSRVLDSCFNGIYEACGTPPSGGKCANSATSSCPYNYNSIVTVSSAGDVTLNERGASSSSSNSAACFGYTTSSGDPYAALRGPVADARRSVMQKYLLDANAACDAYGEQLRATAQNISYQKVAAQQALQQKRLEFAREETEQIASDYRNAINNFNNCLSELYDCYTTQERQNASWSTSRIKSYCSQVSNAPSCYEEMICGTSDSTLQAVIDVPDNGNCTASPDIKKNTCRNIVTISEILSDSYVGSAADKSSKKLREECLEDIGIDGVRTWTRTAASENQGW